MKKTVLFLFILFNVYASNIYIAASANLTYIMPYIIKEFHKKYPSIDVKFITSSSGKLTAQIQRGAPYDIFLSANMKYPEFLYSQGIGIKPPKVYAKGKIIMISMKYKNLSLKNLPQYNSIAISKPQLTPYGKAAVDIFKKSKIYNKIKNKLVYAQNVAAVLSFIKNGADVGLVSKSLIFSDKIKNLEHFFYKDINSSLYRPIKQGALLLNNKKDAQKFYKFLFTQEVKNIFKKYGYQ